MGWWIFALQVSAVASLVGGILAVRWGGGRKYNWCRTYIAIAKDATALAHRYEDALVKIADRKDAYCPEICEHKTCEQSHYATVIAYRALKNVARKHKEGE